MFKDRLKKLFVPHVHNDFKPHILQDGAVVGMMFLLVISFAVSNLHAFLWMNSSWLVSTVLPAVIISDTNKERDNAGIGGLIESEVLARAATLKAEDMAKNSYFAHYSPEGKSPWYWFDQVSYNYAHAGENLAVFFTDSNEVVKAWMESPTHRANILDGEFTEIGIGTAKGKYQGYETVFVVQLFGTKPESTFTSLPAPEPESVSATSGVEVAAVANVTEPEVAGVSIEVAEPTPETPTNSEVDGYSSYISTTSEEVTPIANTSVVSEPSSIATSLTKPHFVLQIIYLIVGSLVFVSLMLSIFIEIRRQQPVQIAYGVGLLFVMVLLFYIHISVTGGVTIS